MRNNAGMLKVRSISFEWLELERCYTKTGYSFAINICDKCGRDAQLCVSTSKRMQIYQSILVCNIKHFSSIPNVFVNAENVYTRLPIQRIRCRRREDLRL